MIALVLGVLLAATPATPTPLERRAMNHVHQEFERVGRRSPHPDPALTEAARRLAQEALDSGVSGAVELLTVTEAVSDAGGADPSPPPYLIPPRYSHIPVHNPL